VELGLAEALARRARARARVVGLFVNPEAEFVERVYQEVGLDVIQLHGDETPAFASALDAEVWKAVPVRTGADLLAAHSYRGAVTRILYDSRPLAGASAPGGSGQRFDWTILRGFQHPLPWILAGGLDPANLSEAVTITGASFVDVSSGVESGPGIKDMDKIAAFLKAARDI
jgi:phosphoribosylanthranilate isomerase